MSTQRLFVALALPEPVRAALVALNAPLPDVTWTNPAQLHLTLRFLGDVVDEKIEPLTEKLAAIRVEPFILPVETLGTFPLKSPPRVLWIGVGGGHPRLFQLRQRLDDTLLAAGLTELDLRTFHPHITLARCGPSAAPALTRWQRQHAEFAAPPFRVTAFDLYSSQLAPSGAVHTLLHRFPLAP